MLIARLCSDISEKIRRDVKKIQVLRGVRCPSQGYTVLDCFKLAFDEEDADSLRIMSSILKRYAQPISSFTYWPPADLAHGNEEGGGERFKAVMDRMKLKDLACVRED